MSIRLTFLYFFIISLSVYAWKDWFKSLCGLTVLMAIIEHGDMPKQMFGIQGLNPWNVLFGIIFLAWLVSRNREGLRWDMPGHISVLLILYLTVIVIGVLRAIFDQSNLGNYSTKDLISEELINTIKWVMPGILLFDGCRTRKRAVMALVCLLLLYFLISVQVVKHMPQSAAFSGGWSMMNARSKLNENVGYHATDLSVLLAGASWGILAALPLIPKKSYKVICLIASAIVVYSIALTGGRGGYIAWGATGLIMCLIKWRKYLILAPVAVILLPIVFPGAAARMMAGFGKTDVSGQASIDENEMLSGRTLFWPHVIDKISESPLIGYGRLAMQRTGLKQFLLEKYGESEAVNHPHNIYLEALLDNGIIGSIPIFILWGIIIYYSSKFFKSSNRLCSAIGGLSLSLMLTSLIGGLSGQHWFPLEHTFGIWAASFLSFRVYLEDKKTQLNIDYPKVPIESF